MQEAMTAAGKYLGPDAAYPAPIKSLAVDVLNGRKSVEALETTVAAFDALKESQNSQNAAAESSAIGNTQGQQRVPGVLELAALFFKAASVSHPVQQYMALHKLQAASVKGQHGDLVRVTNQLDIVTARVLDDLIVPEETGFRHGTAWWEKGWCQVSAPEPSFQDGVCIWRAES